MMNRIRSEHAPAGPFAGGIQPNQGPGNAGASLTGSPHAGLRPALSPFLASRCSKLLRQLSYLERVVM